MATSSSVLLSLTAFLLAVSTATAYTGKVLLVSFDGFRWDYLNNIPGLVNFERLKREGVSVPYMNNTFSTVTFPNHYSIATGLYQESHGIVLNDMYDPRYDAWFHKGQSSAPDVPWWDGGEPIWVSAENQGKTSGVCFWAGGDQSIRGVRPSFSTPFQRDYTWDRKVEDVVSWLTDGEADLALVYDKHPDHAGHYFGPYTLQANESVQDVDRNLGVLLDALDNSGLGDTVNVLVVSDHGMTKVDSSRVVDLNDYIVESDYTVLLAEDSICMISPADGKREAVYEKLHGRHPNMTVWYREDIPERWHYKHNPRILPIVITMDEGWQCVQDASQEWYQHPRGTHGYDNALMSMKAIFLARGADFKRDYSTSNVISNLDIYPLIAHLLGIRPAPNNGSLARTLPFLRESTGVSFSEGNSNSGGASKTGSAVQLVMLSGAVVVLSAAEMFGILIDPMLFLAPSH